MLRKSLGFTIVELLVVIAIIGLLIALLMPAVQAAREVARQSSCQNSLKQIGNGVQQHVTALGHYPTGGWGPTAGSGGWMGDPDQGNGPNQPGGWIYNLLPYIDQLPIHDLGAGAPSTSNTANGTGPGGIATPSRQGANVVRMMTPLPLFICPSRRTATLFPAYPNKIVASPPPLTPTVPYTITAASVTATTYVPMPNANAQPLTGVAKSDYAINRGDGSTPFTNAAGGGVGPAPNVPTDSTCDPTNYGPVPKLPGTPSAVPANWNVYPASTLAATFTGISFVQSMIQPGHIADGTNYTILVGEKAMNPDNYTNGQDPCDQRNMYVGFSGDLYRSTAAAPLQDIPGYPGVGANSPCAFGTPHTNGVNFLFCDGSVRPIRFGINLPLYTSLGNRSDSTNGMLSGGALVYPQIDDSKLK